MKRKTAVTSFVGNKYYVSCISVSENAQIIASCGGSKNIYLYDL